MSAYPAFVGILYHIQMPHLSVVIPVYKAQDCLVELYSRLIAAVKTITDDYEIILVEDCGGDRSWSIINELAKSDPHVKGFQLSRNFGQHYGITAGLDLAQGEWVVIMDCDLEDQPEEISRLYAKAQEGYDIVVARRIERTHGPLKRLASATFYKVFNLLSDMEYDGGAANYRIVSRKVVDTFVQMRERLRFFRGLIDWMGYPTASIDVKHGERFAGRSSYTYQKLFSLAGETVIAYSNRPLRMAVKLGFLLSAASFCFGTYFIGLHMLYSTPIVGWTSLIVSLYFLGGVIIFILGIIGIYLGETFDEVKKRPLYLIGRTTTSGTMPTRERRSVHA